MRLVMMGTGTFAEPTFASLLAGPHAVVGLFTQPDRQTGKEKGSSRLARPGMKELAQAHNVPVFQPESVNTPDGVAALRSLAPDLLVVAAYGQILSNDVLASARLGGVNVHASLLPKYRGAAPINWAIYHGEQQTGVTIIRMTTGLDAGDMLAQEAIPVRLHETAGELEMRLAPLGARLATEVLAKLDAGEPIPGQPQDRAGVTKAPKLTKEHGLIDWSRPAEDVVNQIYAMQPWPTAYTFLHRPGQAPLRLIVSQANEFPVRYDPNAPAGKAFVDSSFPDSLFVVTGLVNDDERSVVEVTALQPAGKRRMGARDFLLGNPLPAGSRLGGA